MLRSERLLLRDFRGDDFEAVHAYATDLEVVRYMTWGPNSEADTRDFLKRAQSHVQVDPRVGFELAVIRERSDDLIGGVGLHVDGFKAMLGYCFARFAWGQGYATEAARVLVDFGFTSLGLHRVWACCDPENPGSIGVLRKLGMRQEGHLKQDCRVRGEWRDNLLFAILEDEWHAGRGAIESDQV
jgi:RimJ/RimL family protein N-acetyltransferase